MDTYPLRNLIRPRCTERAKPGRGKRVAHYAYWQNRHIIFLALVALKLLVSLISRLVACSARTVVDRQTHRTTTVTLAAHARRGLIIWKRTTYSYLINDDKKKIPDFFHFRV